MATAVNTMSHTVIYDDGAIAVGLAPTNAEAFAEGKAKGNSANIEGLREGTHCLYIAPGEGETPISLLLDQYALESSLPCIYYREPITVTGPHPTPFVRASSEIRRTDHRGVHPEHVLVNANEGNAT